MLLPLPSRGLGMPGRRAGSPVEVHVRYARDLSSQPFSELVDHLFRSLTRPITMCLPPATRQSKSKTKMQLHGFVFQIECLLVFRDQY